MCTFSQTAVFVYSFVARSNIVIASDPIFTFTSHAAPSLVLKNLVPETASLLISSLPPCLTGTLHVPVVAEAVAVTIAQGGARRGLFELYEVVHRAMRPKTMRGLLPKPLQQLRSLHQLIPAVAEAGELCSVLIEVGEVTLAEKHLPITRRLPPYKLLESHVLIVTGAGTGRVTAPSEARRAALALTHGITQMLLPQSSQQKRWPGEVTKSSRRSTSPKSLDSNPQGRSRSHEMATSPHTAGTTATNPPSSCPARLPSGRLRPGRANSSQTAAPTSATPTPLGMRSILWNLPSEP